MCVAPSCRKFCAFVVFLSCVFTVHLDRVSVSAQKGKDDSVCTGNSEVRFENGTKQFCSGYTVGRVQLCDGGVWAETVCDYQWTVEDAMVVCRELGHRTEGAVPLTVRQSATSSISSVVPVCSGSEQTVSNCSLQQAEDTTNCPPQRIAFVACPQNISVTNLNLSECSNPFERAIPVADPATTPTSEPNSTNTTEGPDGVTSSPPSTTTSTLETSSTKETTKDVVGATDPSTGSFSSTVIYAAAGAGGGLIVLILVVIVLLVVIVARRRAMKRMISPDSPTKRDPGHEKADDSKDIKPGTLNLDTDLTTGSAPMHLVNTADQPIYEHIKDSNESSPSISLRSGGGDTSVVPIYAKLDESQYAQIQPHVSNNSPHELPEATYSHYHTLNHNTPSVKRNTSSGYQPHAACAVNKTAMEIVSGNATEADVRSPVSTNSQDNSPVHRMEFGNQTEQQTVVNPAVNYSIEDLDSQVSTNAVVNQKMSPENATANHLYAVLEPPCGISPKLPPRMSNSLPRSAPTQRNLNTRSNSMSRVKPNRSPKNLHSSASSSSTTPRSNRRSGSSPKCSRGSSSPYIQRTSLNTSRSSGLSSNSGSESTEGFVNSCHSEEDGPRMNTLV